MFLGLEHGSQSPDRELLLTAAATLRSSELRTSRALSALARLISKRTLSPSRTNWIMPPRRVKPGMSLTVRTPLSSRTVKISFKCFSSVELMYRIRHSPASCGFEIRRSTTGLPSRASPARVESRIVPKGSWPSTQTGNESPLPAGTVPGHLTNLPKL